MYTYKPKCNKKLYTNKNKENNVKKIIEISIMIALIINNYLGNIRLIL